MKILINRYLGDSFSKKLEELGLEIVYVPENELDKRDDFYDVDIWFTYYGFDKVDIERFTNLKYIHTTSTGINQVPIDYVIKNNITVSNNKTGYAIPMAESIIMYILEIYKNSRKMFRQQDDRKWRLDMSWNELMGKRVGFIGTGNIARETVKRLKAFEVEIWGINTDGRDIEGFDRCFPLNDSDEFFRECDIVIGIMPDTSETTGVINRDKFEMMKDGSVFMNIGRGNLVNQQDLIMYMDKFKGVVLDVVEQEPLEYDSRLWEFDNIIITPHNSWVSDGNDRRLAERVYENLKSYIETGMPKEWIKDLKRGY